MVVDGFLIWSGSPSLTGIFHNQHSLNAKSPCSPIGNKDRKDNFCGTTLFAGRSGRSARCQHTGCPLTLAMRRKILRFPRSPRPGRPICRSAFRSALSCAVLSVDALSALLPLQWFAVLKLWMLCNKSVRLSSTNFLELRTNQYSRTTPRTMPMISA